MTRRNPPARYALPADPEPAAYRSFCVNVPDEPMHIAAFLGQIKALASAYAWADDDDHTALLAANAWKPTFDDVSQFKASCGQQTPGILCIGGTFADMSYGTVPGIGAPCSPVRVDGVGWESCFDAVGGHHTLDLLMPFDGSTYIRTAEFHFFRTIPAPYSWSVDFFFAGSSVFHQDDTELGGGGATFSATVDQQADTVVISAVALDGSTTEEIVLDDWQLCYTGDFPLTQPDTWTYIFDFTATDGAPFVGTVLYGHYSAGVGYVSAVAGYPNFTQIRVWIDPGAFECVQLDLVWSFGNLAGNDAGTARGFSGVEGGTMLMVNPAVYGDGSSQTNAIATATPPSTIQSILLGTDAHSAGGGFITLTQLTVHGRGANPFA